MILEGKNINIFGVQDKRMSVVYLHTFRKEGQKVWEQCKKLGVKAFVLIEIDGISWNDDMSPWPVDNFSPDNAAFTGKANEWLKKLTSNIIPEVETPLNVCKRFIAGYSLAGLFALWSAYQTDLFDGIISGSGSFWYPHFIDYVKEQKFPKQPESIYLSLGNKESLTKHPMLKTVRTNTQWLHDHYENQGIRTVFELNNGNHFMQSEWRMAKGIQWTLRN